LSPADTAGLMPGDIVLSVNQKHIQNIHQFALGLYSLAIGQNARLEIQRGKQTTLPGDVIYAVSGKFVDTIESLRSTLDDLKTADAIVLQVERLGTLHYVVLETDR